ncbi:MAG: hypothetical protein WCA28_31445, partial [Bradyrhizobium sp.]
MLNLSDVLALCSSSAGIGQKPFGCGSVYLKSRHRDGTAERLFRREAMNRFATILLVTAVMSSPATAQQSVPTATDTARHAQGTTDGIVPNGKDRIGLTAT